MAILHIYAGVLIFMKYEKYIIILKKKREILLHFYLFLSWKVFKKEQTGTNPLLWPTICRNKRAITPKGINSRRLTLDSQERVETIRKWPFWLLLSTKLSTAMFMIMYYLVTYKVFEISKCLFSSFYCTTVRYLLPTLL